MAKKYVVTLKEEEREQLRGMLGSGNAKARTLTHARILMKALAGLAGTKWMQGDRAGSLSLVEQVLDFLARQPFEGVDEPVQIYLTCYHVLKDFGDRGAADVLGQAHDQLMANAGKIFDPAIRTAFLKNVPAIVN